MDWRNEVNTFQIGFAIAITIMPAIYLTLLFFKYNQRFSVAMAGTCYFAFLLTWDILVMR